MTNVSLTSDIHSVVRSGAAAGTAHFAQRDDTTGPDVLSTLLNAMRVSASLLLSERYPEPWSIDVPSSQTLARAFNFSRDTHVVAFHLVREGTLHIRTQPAAPSAGDVVVRAGEAVILFDGAEHRLYCGDGAQRLTLDDILAGKRPGRTGDSNASSTSLVCGAFALRHTRLNPLFDTLPALAVLSLQGGNDWLTSAAARLFAELESPSPGSDFVVKRLLELMCAASVRESIASSELNPTSLYLALDDAVVSKVLALIHRDPGLAWSVVSLARHVNLSRSRLSERFTSVVGEPLMQYLSKWRMNLATRLLCESRAPVQQIALDAGYESAAAFSRAFKQQLGTSPAQYRRDVGSN